MKNLLHFVNLGDAVPLLFLILILRVIASQVIDHDPKALRIINGFGYGGLLAYLLAGWVEWKPARPLPVLELVVRAIIARELVRGLAAILYPLGRKVWEHATKRSPEPPRPLAPEMVPAPKPPPPPPSPLPVPPRRSIEQQQAEAKQRYDDRVRMLTTAGLDATELAAALEQAKRDYLCELDGMTT